MGVGRGGWAWGEEPLQALLSCFFCVVTPTRIQTVLTQGMSVTLWVAGTHPLRAEEVGEPTWIGAEAGRSVGRGETPGRWPGGWD